MERAEHNYAVDYPQELHAVNVVRSCRNCHTFKVDDKFKVDHHQATRIAVVIVAERLGQSVVLCFIDIAQHSIPSHDVIHFHVDFLVQNMLEIGGVRLNGLSNAIIYEGVASRGFIR